jgi:hypothetical protein
MRASGANRPARGHTLSDPRVPGMEVANPSRPPQIRRTLARRISTSSNRICVPSLVASISPDRGLRRFWVYLDNLPRPYRVQHVNRLQVVVVSSN